MVGDRLPTRPTWRRRASRRRCWASTIEFRKLSVYDVGALGERFDIVLFMGVLYHLRHPLLALDLIREHVAGDMLVFQSMQRGSARRSSRSREDYPFAETALFDEPGWPKLHFVEHRYAGDPTNWWVPNRACAEAMLRSAGFAHREPPRGGGLSLPASRSGPTARKRSTRRGRSSAA